jgi:hypothetical protein
MKESNDFMRLIMRVVIALLSLVVAGGSQARGQQHKLFPNTSVSGPQDFTLEKAGNPTTISRWAHPGIEKHERPGLIGGSRLFGGDGPGEYDGTFGWDYAPWRPGRVFLGWSHDRAHQPKMGSYKTDTHKVPDPIALHPIRKLFEARDH